MTLKIIASNHYISNQLFNVLLSKPYTPGSNWSLSPTRKHNFIFLILLLIDIHSQSVLYIFFRLSLGRCPRQCKLASLGRDTCPSQTPTSYFGIHKFAKNIRGQSAISEYRIAYKCYQFLQYFIL